MNHAGPCSHRGWDFKPVVALTVLCALVFASGLTAIPVLDRDEARFAQVTVQMLESGDYWTVAYQDVVQTGKPHAVHWLQAASVWAFSGTEERAIWAYRLPSVIAAWVAVLFTYLLGRDLFGRRQGLIAGAFLAVTPVLIAIAHIATADALLLATVVAAHWPLARAHLACHGGPAPRCGMAVLFWSSLVASALTKGAIGPAVIALTVASLSVMERRVGWLKPLWPVVGAPISAVVLAGWASRAGILPETASALRELIWDAIPRSYFGPELQGAPPGIHALIGLIGLGPAVPFVVLGVAGAFREWGLPQVRFCVAWAAPAWVATEFIAAKLPHYPMPLYPALVLLACWGLSTHERDDSTGGRVVISVWGSMIAALSLSMIGYLAIPAWQPDLASVDIVGLALINLLGALAIIILGAAGRPRAVAAMAVATVAAISVCGASVAFPRIEPFRVTDRIVEALNRSGGLDGRRLVSVGYGEPSLVFRTATNTTLLDHERDARFVSTGEPVVFAVDERRRAGFEQRASTSGAVRAPGAAVSGFNYSSGRWITVWLYFP